MMQGACSIFRGPEKAHNVDASPRFRIAVACIFASSCMKRSSPFICMHLQLFYSSNIYSMHFLHVSVTASLLTARYLRYSLLTGNKLFHFLFYSTDPRHDPSLSTKKNRSVSGATGVFKKSSFFRFQQKVPSGYFATS